MFGLERRLVYFPDRTHLRTPASIGLEFEDVWITTSDKELLHAWWVPGTGRNAMILFHGNAGNISFRLGEAALLRGRLQASMLLFDYRGYGLSTGRPSEAGTRLDAEAAARWLVAERQISTERLIYFGRSLGAAVATHLASEVRPAALILESPLPSVARLTRLSYPWLAPVIAPLMVTRYDTLGVLKAVKCPVFVAHGDDDEVIPFELGREVFEAAGEPKVWYPVAGGGHNDMAVVGGTTYLEAIEAFVTEHVGGSMAA